MIEETLIYSESWSRASILCVSLLVTAQHSEPYRKMGGVQVLYSFGLLEMEIDSLLPDIIVYRCTALF